MEHILPPLWQHTPTWHAQVDDWIGQELERLGRRLQGTVSQVRRLAWSVVLRIPTEAGNVYFKAVDPQLTFEVRLVQALGAWQPDLVLAPLAVDPRRGWMLLPEGGERLREAIRSERNPAPLRELLPRYAALQIALAPRADEMVALGAPDRRLARLPDLYASLLEDRSVLRVGQAKGLSQDELSRLHALKPRLAELCDQLAAYPIPLSIHHGDLNDSNVFYNPEQPPEQRFRLFDWGDGSVSHPFFSMRTVLVSLEMSMEWDEDDPRDDPFIDLYLQSWQAYAGLEALHGAYRLSRPLAAVVSALSWQQGQANVPEAARVEYAHAVPSLLQEFMTLAG